MVWFHREILLPKFYRGPHAITGIVMDAMPEIAEIRVGLLHLFLKHTSASLAITENADRNVLADLEQCSTSWRLRISPTATARKAPTTCRAT